MKKIVLLISFLVFAFSKEYSIIAFSTKNFDLKAAKLFIKRFPNGIVKKYSRFVEYKIEPFKNYKEAKKFLEKVKKYYKYPLIIPYNPYLGEVLYPLNNITIKKYKQKIVTLNKNSKIIYCKNECGCNKNNLQNWEINKSKILKRIDVKVKKYLKFSENNNTTVIYQNKKESSKKQMSTIIGCNFPNISDYLFYIDLFANTYGGQKFNTRLNGDNKNVKLGILYSRYFLNNWNFFTDSRLIYSRIHTKNVSNKFYLDINEFYIRSFCLICNNADILIGRKKTKDFRSWWYDASLDQIKLFNEDDLFTFEIIGATRINNNIITDNNSNKAKVKHSNFLILHGNYEYKYKNNVGIYYIYEDSKPKIDSIKHRIINFAGIDLFGLRNSIKYWLNVGYSTGDEILIDKTNHISGLGIDIGLLKKINKKSSIGGSYAYGGVNFRQPIIATNYSDYLHKNFKYKYYGYIIDPYLDNLHIISLFYIYDIDNFKTFILALHNYTQDVSKAYTYNGTYLFSTNGKNKNIGNEFDLVYQYLKNKKRKFKVGFAYFIGGDAYRYLKNKNAVRLFLNYRYYWK